MSGWICSYRSIWDHPFFKGNGMRVAVWHWLLHHAAWQETTHKAGGATLTVRRGEVCFSQQQIQDDTGASRKQVRDVIEWLIKGQKATKIGANERANEGASVRANAKTILRIEKYEEYQAKESGRANEGASGRADKGPTKEQGLTNKTTLEDTDVSSLSAKADAKAEIAEAVIAFKESAKRQGWSVVRNLSKTRQSALKARLREAGGLDGWREALRKAEASDHCNGDNERGWVITFDFLTSQKSFAKLMEGNYDNRPSKAATRNAGRHSPHDALMAGFAAYANSDDDAGPNDFGAMHGSYDTSTEEMAFGQGGSASQPLLRVIGES